MWNSGEKKYSNSRVVRKKISERNKEKSCQIIILRIYVPSTHA